MRFVRLILSNANILLGLLLVVACYWAIETAQAQEEGAQAVLSEVANSAPSTPPAGFAPVPGLPIMTVTDMPSGQKDYSVTLQVLLLMTALSFLPAMLMTMTSFTRIIIVFSILRQALGLQQSPSNQILIGLSLFLTFFIMSPVLEKVYTTAYTPYAESQITARGALDRA